MGFETVLLAIDSASNTVPIEQRWTVYDAPLPDWMLPEC